MLGVSFLALALVACDQPSEVPSEQAQAPDAPPGEAIEVLPASGTPAGELPDEVGLEADTVMAARYGSADADSSHIGVWAAGEDGCGLIDGEEEPGDFAIITPSSIRDELGSCTTAPAENEAAFTFAATCFEDGASSERQISVELLEDGQLSYRASPESEPVELRRCVLGG